VILFRCRTRHRRRTRSSAALRPRYASRDKTHDAPRFTHTPLTTYQVDPTECSKAFCLFNITADPCEYTNLADQHPDVVAQVQERLAAFSATAVPPTTTIGCNPKIVKLPNGAKAWQPCDI
jgi:hypothetical protein